MHSRSCLIRVIFTEAIEPFFRRPAYMVDCSRIDLNRDQYDELLRVRFDVLFGDIETERHYMLAH